MSYGKIKRNRDIFGSEKKRKARSLFRFLLWTVILFAVGLLLFDVIFNIVTKTKDESSPKEEVVSQNTSSEKLDDIKEEQALETSANETKNDAEKGAETEDEALNVEFLNYVYMDKSLLKDKATFEKTLTELKSGGVLGVCFDVKDSTGKLLFNPSFDFAKTLEVDEAKAENIKKSAIESGFENVNLSDAVKLAKDKGLKVCLREYGFRDYVIPYQTPNAAIKYKDTNLIWLDAPQEQGGLPWLNPYSKAAQDYVLAIAKEALLSGADCVLLEDVSFPPDKNQGVANYGNVNKSQSEQIAEFGKKLMALEKETGKKLYAEVSAKELLSPDGRLYGSNPYALMTSSVAVNISPSQFNKNFKFSDGEKLSSLLANEEKLSEKILSSLDELAPFKEKKEKGEMTIIALGTSRESVSAQIKSAKTQGFKNGISIIK